MKNKKEIISEDDTTFGIKKNIHSESSNFSSNNKNTKIMTPKMNFFKRLKSFLHKQGSNKADSNNYPLW